MGVSLVHLVVQCLPNHGLELETKNHEKFVRAMYRMNLYTLIITDTVNLKKEVFSD